MPIQRIAGAMRATCSCGGRRFDHLGRFITPASRLKKCHNPLALAP
jgi:hypothetical protein